MKISKKEEIKIKKLNEAKNLIKSVLEETKIIGSFGALLNSSLINIEHAKDCIYINDSNKEDEKLYVKIEEI